MKIGEPPPLLPPITPKDIELLCWLGIEPEAGEGHRLGIIRPKGKKLGTLKINRCQILIDSY